MAERNPRVLAIDAGGTMTDTLHRRRAPARSSSARRRRRPRTSRAGFMRSRRGRARRSGARPPRRRSRRSSPASTPARRCSTGCSQRKGLRDRRDRHRRPGGLPAARARHPDLPRLLLRRPAARHHALPQRAARPARADEGRPRPDRRVRATRCSRCARTTCARPRPTLLDAGVEGIVVCLLFSLPSTPSTSCGSARSSPRSRPSGADGDVPVFLSSRALPAAPRLPAAELDPDRGLRRRAVARHRCRRCATRRKAAGAGFELRVMAAHGGTISIEANELARTLVSGPIGGVVGGQLRWPSAIGLERALHRHRRHQLRHRADHRRPLRDHARRPTSRRFMLNMPLVEIDSIGAGTGSFVRVNPNSQPARDRARLGRRADRRRAGPRAGWRRSRSPTSTSSSAGSTPTTSSAATSRSTPSAPAAEVKRQVAEPLGLGLEEAAAGVDRAVRGDAAQRGRRPRSSARATRPPTTRCSATAAAGRCTSPATPRGVAYRDVLVPAWAAGFSAFGCACADFEYRYDQTDRLPIAAERRRDARRRASGAWSRGAWHGLQAAGRGRVREVAASSRDAIAFTHVVRMQYFGQLNDIEIVSPPRSSRRASTSTP